MQLQSTKLSFTVLYSLTQNFGAIKKQIKNVVFLTYSYLHAADIYIF